MIQTTSGEAFIHIQNALNHKESEVLEAIKLLQPISDRELASHLAWEIGSVNGRRNELMHKGLIEEAYKDISPLTHKRVIYWRIKQTKPVFAEETPFIQREVEQVRLFDIPTERRQIRI